MRLVAVDLFCGGGGAARGLLQAGFDSVIGVDIDRRCSKSYPGQFICGDALSTETQRLWVDRDDIALVWASPPCQIHSKTRVFVAAMEKRREAKTEFIQDLVGETRALLVGGEWEWVIENVPGAPLRPDIRLCGGLVGLPRLHRVRHFECSFTPPLLPPVTPPAGRVADGTLVTVTTGHGMIRRRDVEARHARGMPGSFRRSEMAEAMGIAVDSRMTRREIGLAVPPAYARLIGEHFIATKTGL